MPFLVVLFRGYCVVINVRTGFNILIILLRVVNDCMYGTLDAGWKISGQCYRNYRPVVTRMSVRLLTMASHYAKAIFW